MLSALRRAAIGYGKASEKRPIAAATLSTGVIFGLGDVLVQAPTGELEKERTGRMAVYGTGVFGPFLGVWYAHVLPRLVPISGAPTFVPILKKVAYDEAIESSFGAASFLYCVEGMETGSHEAAVKRTKEDFFRVYITDLMVWPAIQFANFYFVPNHLQAAVVALVSVGWGGYLSYVAADKPKEN
jgi:protein Mpv17